MPRVGYLLPRIVIFFSLSEPPLPDPTQHLKTRQKPPKTDRIGPKRTRNGPKWTELDTQRALRDILMPSPKLPLKLPSPFPHNRGHFFLFQNCTRGEGNCAAIERQKLSRGMPRGIKIQKTVPGRVRVKFAQNGGHEKATKKPRKNHEKETKKARTLFL